MPTYSFYCSESNKQFEQFMSISELDLFLKQNPNITQLVNGAPMIHSGRGLGKPDAGFRDLLKNIKQKHSQGISRSTVETF